MLNEIFEDCELLLDDCRGIYIPRDFAINFDIEEWGISEEDAKILLAGPDHELYWEAWDDVLRSAEYTDPNGKIWYLMQDGDLFAVVYPECTK